MVLDTGELKSSAPLEALVFWKANAKGEAMPPVSSIDPTLLKHILPHIVLIDVIWPQAEEGQGVGDQPADFRYRLIGQHSVDAHGANLTGMMVSTLTQFGQEYTDQAMRFYSQICHKREPVAVRGPLKMIGKDYRQFEAVYLPFSAGNGRVDRIMAAVNYS